MSLDENNPYRLPNPERGELDALRKERIEKYGPAISFIPPGRAEVRIFRFDPHSSNPNLSTLQDNVYLSKEGARVGSPLPYYSTSSNPHRAPELRVKENDNLDTSPISSIHRTRDTTYTIFLEDGTYFVLEGDPFVVIAHAVSELVSGTIEWVQGAFRRASDLLNDTDTK